MTDAQRFQFIRDDEVHNLADPEWLVDEVLPAAGTAILFGPRGSGKTAATIDLSYCIGTGTRFHGRAVRQGPVVYIYAEGRAGIKARSLAWKEANRISGFGNVYFLPHSVQLLDQVQVEAFTRSIEALGIRPALIVVDTVAKNTPGGDENSGADRSRVTWAAEQWRERFGASTLLIGHNDKKRGRTLKGNEELENAADASIRVEREDEDLTFHCEKMREGEPFKAFTLTLTPYASSVILTSGEGTATTATRPTKLQLRALQCLQDIAPSLGCSNSVWERSCTEDGTMSVRTFWSAKKRLLEIGYIIEVRGGKGFAVSPEGLDFLQLQSDCNSTAITGEAPTASVLPPLYGGHAAVPAVSKEFSRGDAWEPEAAA